MLNTIVITTEVTPLPKLRAEQLLKSAQTLAEKKDRSKEESDKLAKYFQGTREQLEMAELLGYGSKKDFKPMYEQLDQMAKKSADGNSGTGYATLMLMQGMLANTGIPSDAGRIAMIKAAAALASDAIEFAAREAPD